MRVVTVWLAVPALVIPAAAARARPRDSSKVEVRATRLAEDVQVHAPPAPKAKAVLHSVGAIPAGALGR